MSLNQIEVAVTQLPKADLTTFAQWFEEYLADEWDRQIEADVKAGKLNHLMNQADVDFQAGRCTLL